MSLDRHWLDEGFWPESIFDAPFREVNATPAWPNVLPVLEDDAGVWGGSLEGFAAALLEVLREQLATVKEPVHMLLSGGYDSRILAALMEHEFPRVMPLYVTDGDELPTSNVVREYLNIPKERCYVHDMDRPDPYGLADATVLGWAPIYQQMRFTPEPPKSTTLVTGLGGGEWFDYPASGWHVPRKHRLEHSSVVAMWLDTWPNYWLLPERWAEGYAWTLHPYTTPEYARVANRCRPEWLSRSGEHPELDRVREAMLNLLDPELAGLGYEPHRYDWRLDAESAERIDERFRSSWLASHLTEVGQPSRMDLDEYACVMGGFAQWCDDLIANGHTIEVM